MAIREYLRVLERRQTDGEQGRQTVADRRTRDRKINRIHKNF